MYAVTTDEVSQRQIDALPANALTSIAEVRVVLELAPWSGRPYHSRNPDGPMRTLTFGLGSGSVIYLILEDQRRVDILDVVWIDIR